MKPKISILVCTYNGEHLIKNCLDSILNQNFKNFEVLCIDGGSSDKTLPIIKGYVKKDKRFKLIHNQKKLPEGKGFGKWLGYTKSKGEIIGIIDQDNILQRNDLFKIVEKTFSKNKKVVGVLGGVKHDSSDKGIVRYVSLTGTDGFFAYRSIDFLRNINEFEKDSESVERVSLEKDNLSMTGGNCFFYSKKDLDKMGGYEGDIMNVSKIVGNGKKPLFIVENSTKHYAEKNLYSLAKKKFKWGEAYYDKGERFNYFPTTKKEKKEFYKNLIFNLSILPNFYYSIKLYKKSKDPISFWFPPFAFLNTLAYGFNFLKSVFRK